MKNTVKEIIAKKNERLVQRKLELSEADLRNKIEATPAPKSLIKSISKPRAISLIAEIKKASPSRGVIREDFNVETIADIYKQAGVQAISVLTEEDYFLGSVTYLQQVKEITGLPVLRKDFIVEPYQIYESRAFGCDALLLITELLSQETLSEFLNLAQILGLECLVEAHTEKGLKKAIKAKASLIGLNNRDLKTQEVDLKTTEKLYPLVPKEIPVVVESGLKSYNDILFLKVLGVKAVLIGEAFMGAEDIDSKVKDIMGW